MNWLMNTGSMKWSKMICSLCENIKSIFNIVVNILHLHICFVYSYSAQTSVISSLSRFCLGCSSGGAYINSFLETKHEVTVNKFHVKDVVGEMKTDKYAEAAKVNKCVRCKDRGGILMRTLASSNIPSESSPQIHSRPSPAVCVAGCHCCTGATGCPDGHLPRGHLTPSGHLPKKWMLRFFQRF